jgi:GNAT superfamily N-acetyltransferase
MDMTIIRESRPDEATTVRDLYDEMCNTHDARVPEGWGTLSPASLERIRDNMERTPEVDDALCLVAEDEGRLVGFVTGALDRHPVMPGWAGDIEEMYVVERADAAELRRELARRAIDWLRERGAWTIHATVALEAPWTEEEIRFWSELGFEHDLTLLSLYREDGCGD